MNAAKQEQAKVKIENKTDLIQDFVNDYLAREMHLGWGMERPTYLMEYRLDLAKIKEYAESDRFHELTDEEVAQFHLSPKEMEKLFQDSQKDHRENNWYDACREILELLDLDYEKTMELLNKYLVYQVVSESDREYPDFVEPEWKVVNEKRYNISFSDLSLSKYEEKVVQLKGYLTYVQNPPTERIAEAEWACRKCGGVQISDFTAPGYCNACGMNTQWNIIEDRIRKERVQEGLITEDYDSSASGYQLSLLVMFSGDNTGKFAPGNHVSIVGRVTGKLMKTKGKDPFYAYIIEVNQARIDERQISITPQDIEEIEAFSRNEVNVIDSLSELYAPGIIGYKTVKKAIVLQAAGSDDVLKGGIRVRGNIHILLVGDPGTGKSQLLMATKQISPKAIYVTDASAAGLTAAVDEVNGKRVMVAGVMVLADGGIAAIDELEKMSKEDSKALLPAMEQGVVAKHKAGLDAILPSRTSVLAAANPTYGRFIDSDPIPKQIDLKPPLLNRFDLIFIFKERIGSVEYEKQRAVAILNGDGTEDRGDFLLKYITHSRKFHPTLSEVTNDKITDYFAVLRYASKDKDASINTRSLEAMKRLARASARARLHDTTDEIDFENAKELIEMYLGQFNNDMDAIGGITNTVRDCIIYLRSLIKHDEKTSELDIISQCKTLGFSVSNVRTALDEMRREGEIYCPSDGMYRGVMR